MKHRGQTRQNGEAGRVKKARALGSALFKGAFQVGRGSVLRLYHQAHSIVIKRGCIGWTGS